MPTNWMVAGACPLRQLKNDCGRKRLRMELLAVDVREAARLTSLSARTIRRNIRLGRLDGVRVGRRILVPVESLKALLHVDKTDHGG